MPLIYSRETSKVRGKKGARRFFTLCGCQDMCKPNYPCCYPSPHLLITQVPLQCLGLPLSHTFLSTKSTFPKSHVAIGNLPLAFFPPPHPHNPTQCPMLTLSQIYVAPPLGSIFQKLAGSHRPKKVVKGGSFMIPLLSLGSKRKWWWRQRHRWRWQP